MLANVVPTIFVFGIIEKIECKICLNKQYIALYGNS